MNQISNFVALQLVFSTLFILGKCQEMPLIFNTETNEVINVKNLKAADEPKLAIACPGPVRVNSFSEKRPSDSSSSEELLLVKKIITKSDLRETSFEICKIPFKPSTIINKSTDEVEFGYKIFYEKSFKGQLKESPRENYAPISDLPTSQPLLVRQLSRTRTLLKSLTFPRDNPPEMNVEHEEMSFLWIPMFSLSFNRDDLNPNWITYETEIDFPDPSKTCENYELGETIYEGVDLKEVYEQKNVNKVFEDVVRPQNKGNEKEDFFPELADENNQLCITRWSLIPDKYFYLRTAKSLTCSYLSTAPVWCYLATELLKPLDEYIDIITEKIQPMGGKLHITSGTNIMTLEMPTKLKKFIKKKKINLARRKGRIPMPTSVYKIVEYCAKNQKTCMYSVIIEIINNPYTQTDHQICKKSNCEEWGWNSVYKNDGTQPRYIKCCKLTSEIWEQLRLSENRKQPINYTQFNLNNFLISSNNEKDQPSIEILKTAVDKRIQELRTKSELDTDEKIQASGVETSAAQLPDQADHVNQGDSIVPDQANHVNQEDSTD